ncbi:polysaccharide deacetylase family protein [Accumulibacter sp.]|uniref:polysaccharide deacetylase family protein n=1 Tax=Accumulibacter sp. TaxID=2053492 RepID=UPI0025DC7E5B|nr:polysaccharide deacetylase family protein [Accumulibacter sp.]MCP5227373.1 polysaccharide deacetylase family protein [Accumulibacter sp.]
MVMKAVARMLSPGGRKGRLSILIFHRVLARRDAIMNWDRDALEFERAIAWLKAWFNVLPLDEAIVRLRDRSLPACAAAITFDDGYADNCTVAMPILQSHGLTATFFIATGYLDGGRMWNDTVVEAVRRCRTASLDLSAEGLGRYELGSPEAIREAIMSILNQVKYQDPRERLKTVDYVASVAGGVLPSDLMLTSEQVKMMRRAGMSIGAHTVTHPIIGRLGPDEVRAEIVGSKEFLESLLQERVGLFAYPNGQPTLDYRREDAEAIRSLGFDAAVTTASGVADADSDLMQLPRFTPWERTRLRFGVRLFRNILQNPGLRAGQLAD